MPTSRVTHIILQILFFVIVFIFFDGGRMRAVHDRKALEPGLRGLIEGRYTLRQVSYITGYSIRQLSRLKGLFQEHGPRALVNGHTGKPSGRRYPDETRERIINIYKKEFSGFNFNFFRHELEESYGMRISYRTIYRILTDAGIESPEKRRKKKQKEVHRPRYRRDCQGELIQVDATPFKWFSWAGDNGYYTLHGAIDDATETITGLTMTLNECSYGYYDILEQTIDRYGVMTEFYSDRSSIFVASKKDKDKLTVQEQLAGIKEKKTQFQRVLDQFRIKQVLAWSPQAKGRVERMWRTLQGRLPWYFRRYKINTIEAANSFMQREYIDIFNKEFAIEREKAPVWRQPHEDWRQHLCSRFPRSVNRAGVFSFQGYRFRILGDDIVSCMVDLCVYKDKLKVLYCGAYYDIELVDDIMDGIGEKMSESLKVIIDKYMLSDTKKLSD